MSLIHLKKQTTNPQKYYWHFSCRKYCTTSMSLWVSKSNHNYKSIYDINVSPSKGNGRTANPNGYEFCSRDDVIYKNRQPLTEAASWVNNTLHVINFALACQ